MNEPIETPQQHAVVLKLLQQASDLETQANELRKEAYALSNEIQSSADAVADQIGVRGRARKRIKRLGITSIAELASMSTWTLLEAANSDGRPCRNFGRDSLNEIISGLAKLGLKLKG